MTKYTCIGAFAYISTSAATTCTNAGSEVTAQKCTTSAQKFY